MFILVSGSELNEGDDEHETSSSAADATANLNPYSTVDNLSTTVHAGDAVSEISL